MREKWYFGNIMRRNSDEAVLEIIVENKKNSTRIREWYESK